MHEQCVSFQTKIFLWGNLEAAKRYIFLLSSSSQDSHHHSIRHDFSSVLFLSNLLFRSNITVMDSQTGRHFHLWLLAFSLVVLWWCSPVPNVTNKTLGEKNSNKTDPKTNVILVKGMMFHSALSLEKCLLFLPWSSSSDPLPTPMSSLVVSSLIFSFSLSCCHQQQSPLCFLFFAVFASSLLWCWCHLRLTLWHILPLKEWLVSCTQQAKAMSQCILPVLLMNLSFFRPKLLSRRSLFKKRFRDIDIESQGENTVIPCT